MLCAAVAAAAIAAPLSACASRPPDFFLDDYALPFSADYFSADFSVIGDNAYRSYVKLEGDPESIGHSRFLAMNVTDRTQPGFTHKFKLFDTQTGAYVSEEVYDEIENLGETGFVRCSKLLSDKSVRATVYTDGGEVLVSEAYGSSADDQPRVVRSNRYAVDGIPRTVYELIYRTDATAQRSKYFLRNAALKRNEEIPAERISRVSSSADGAAPVHLGTGLTDAGKRSALDGRYVLQQCESLPFGEEHELLNGTLRFFRGSEETSALQLENALLWGYFHSYAYYYELEELPANANKGFNVELSEKNGESRKFKSTLYRYDIAESEREELSSDECFYIATEQRLYNYAANEYDRAYVTGYDFVNGVARLSGAASSYIVDEEAALRKRLADKPLYDFTEVVKLKDGRFLVGNQLTDGEMNPIKTFRYAAAYLSAELIVCNDGDGAKDYVLDFDGNTVIEPKFSDLKFYGKSAFANIETSEIKLRELILSKEYPQGRTIFAAADLRGDSKITTHGGLIFASAPSDNSIALSVYNLEGNKLAEFKNYSAPNHPEAVSYGFHYVLIKVQNTHYLFR